MNFASAFGGVNVSAAIRQVTVRVHRYLALVLAAFLMLSGLSGAALAWHTELDHLLAAPMFVLAKSSASREQRNIFSLREAGERAAPGYVVNMMDFTRKPGEPQLFQVSAKPGVTSTYDEIALDPATGHLLARRGASSLSDGWISLMPVIYGLHRSLLAGSLGETILGIAALGWAFNCLIGAYLTWPIARRTHRSPAAWSKAWLRSWQIRKPRSLLMFAFDLHAATGLWLWTLFLAIAWSGVGFNLPIVYEPVMQALSGLEVSAPLPSRNNLTPRLDWRQAYGLARQRMTEEAVTHHFHVLSERLMMYDPLLHIYTYRVRSSLDPDQVGNTQVLIDADDGRLVRLDRPTGASAGGTIETWLDDLHEARLFGMVTKLLSTVAGLGLAVLSVSGLILWWKRSR